MQLALNEKLDKLEKIILESQSNNQSLNEQIDTLNFELSEKIGQIKLLEQQMKDL